MSGGAPLLPDTPFARSLGIEIAGIEGDVVRLRMPFSNRVTGRPDLLHGGSIGGLFDMAVMANLRHALSDASPEARIERVNMTVRYLRAGRKLLTYADAEIIRLGRTLATVSARAWQEDRNRPIATAEASLLVLRPD